MLEVNINGVRSATVTSTRSITSKSSKNAAAVGKAFKNTVVFNRPFAFYLENTNTGTVSFMGILSDPYL